MTKDSYRMRMYKRRLWEQRGYILLGWSLAWMVGCLIVAIIAKAAQ